MIKNGNRIFILIGIMFGISIFFSNVIYGVSNKEKEYTGNFNHTIPFSSKEETDTYYYSDSYFDKSSKAKNEHLRTFSFDVAVAVSPSYYGKKADNIMKLLEEIDFSTEDAELEEFFNTPTKNTIGSLICHKNIKGEELILVAIRGEGYKTEWASNMLVGESGNHKGFQEASDKIVQRIKNYKEKYGIGSSKIWIVGFSRAGAVANLTGKYLNDNLSEFDVKENDLYVYTFEAPNSCCEDRIYENIHTVRNSNDIITYIPPTSWGLYSNGVVEEISDEIFIPQRFFEYDLKKFTISFSDVEDGMILTDEFLKEFFEWLGTNFSREEYSRYLEEDLSELIGMYFGAEYSVRLAYEDLMEKLILTVLEDGTFNKIALFRSLINSSSSEKNDDKITNDLESYLEKTKEKYELDEKADDFYQALVKVIPGLVKAFQPLIAVDFLNENHLIHFITLISNMNEIGLNHFPSPNLSLMQKMDSNFNPSLVPVEESNHSGSGNLVIFYGIIIFFIIIFILVVVRIKKRLK